MQLEMKWRAGRFGKDSHKVAKK
jgi:hypothetical protein